MTETGEGDRLLLTRERWCAGRTDLRNGCTLDAAVTHLAATQTDVHCSRDISGIGMLFGGSGASQ